MHHRIRDLRVARTGDLAVQLQTKPVYKVPKQHRVLRIREKASPILEDAREPDVVVIKDVGHVDSVKLDRWGYTMTSKASLSDSGRKHRGVEAAERDGDIERA